KLGIMAGQAANFELLKKVCETNRLAGTPLSLRNPRFRYTGTQCGGRLLAVSLKTEPLALGTTQNALQNFQQPCGGQADLRRGVMTSVQRGRTKIQIAA